MTSYRVEIYNRSTCHVFVQFNDAYFLLKCSKKCSKCDLDGEDSPLKTSIKNYKTRFNFYQTDLKKLRKIVNKKSSQVALGIGAGTAALGIAATKNEKIKKNIQKASNLFVDDEKAKEKFITNIKGAKADAVNILKNPIGKTALNSGVQTLLNNGNTEQFGKNFTKDLSDYYIAQTWRTTGYSIKHCVKNKSIADLATVPQKSFTNFSNDVKDFGNNGTKLIKHSGLAMHNGSRAISHSIGKGIKSDNIGPAIAIGGLFIAAFGGIGLSLSSSDTYIEVNPSKLPEKTLTRIIIEDGKIWGFSVRSIQKSV